MRLTWQGAIAMSLVRFVTTKLIQRTVGTIGKLISRCAVRSPPWDSILALAGHTALAATFTWSGSGAADWGTAGDWVNNALPGAGDVALFSGPSYYNYQPTLAAAYPVGGLWDTGTASLTVGGSTLNLNGTTINGNAFTGIEMDPGAGR